MKKQKHPFIIIALLCLCFASASAQGDLGMHFNRQLPQSSYTNPAFIQQGWSVGLPVLSSFGFAYNQRGLAFGDFFSRGDSLKFDMDPAISKMRVRNYLSTETCVDLFSANYTNVQASFGVNITDKAYVRASYSKELMQLLWLGSASIVGATPDYNAYLNATRYRELGLRYARKLGKLEVGGRVKILEGLANLNIKRSDLFDLYIDTAAYALKGGSNVYMQTAGMHTRRNAGLAKNLLNMNSLGVGLDLGATYSMLNGRLTISASVIDLGRIAWRDDIRNLRIQGIAPQVPLDASQGELLDTAVANGLLDSLRAVNGPAFDQYSYSSSLVPKSYISALARTSPTVSWGVLLYTEYSDRPRVSMMLHYNKELSSSLKLSASYAVINGTASNFGIGMQWKHGVYACFANTDNVFALFGTTHRLVYTEGTAGLYIPASAQVCALRAGVMISFVKKEQPNVPSLPF